MLLYRVELAIYSIESSVFQLIIRENEPNNHCFAAVGTDERDSAPWRKPIFV